MYLGSCYRPPDKKLNYLDSLRDSLDLMCSKHPNKPPYIILCCDFNYPRINWADCTAPSLGEGKYLLDIINDYHLHQLIDTPTYLSRDVAMLDIVLTTYPFILSELAVGREFSDHCVVSFVINEAIKENVDPDRRIFLLDKGNYNAFRKDMEPFQTSFFSCSPESNTVNQNWDKLK